MESNRIDRLCVVSVVFPYTDNATLLAVKTELDKVLATMETAKIEYRFVEVKGQQPNGGQDRSTDVPGADRT